MAAIVSATAPASENIASTMSGGMAPKTSQAAQRVGGHHTEVLRTEYTNTEMWVVTQVGRIGSIVRASQLVGESGDKVIVCRTLFGKRDDDMHDLFARVVAEKIIGTTGKNLTLAFALKPEVDSEQLKSIVDLCCSVLLM